MFLKFEKKMRIIHKIAGIVDRIELSEVEFSCK